MGYMILLFTIYLISWGINYFRFLERDDYKNFVKSKEFVTLEEILREFSSYILVAIFFAPIVVIYETIMRVLGFRIK